MTHPALIPVTTFAIGIAMAKYLPMPIWGIVALAAGTVAFAALGRTLSAIATGLTMTGYICGAAALPEPLPASLDGKSVQIIGEIIKAETDADYNRYVLEVTQYAEAKGIKAKSIKTGGINAKNTEAKSAKAEGAYRPNVYDTKFRTILYNNGIHTYQPGDIVSAKGTLHDARAKDIVPDAADYNEYLYLQGVNSTFHQTGDGMRQVRKASGNFLDNALKKARAATINAIIDSGAGSHTSAFLCAVLVGDDTYLQPDIDEAFRTSGLAHLLALSGLHVGIIIMFITISLSWMRPARLGYILFYILLIIATFAYAAFAGMTPSVVRAAGMTAVFCISALSQRRPNVFNSLCASVFLWLVINPLWLFAPGFQMSVCAVIGITVAVRAVNAYHIHPWFKKVIGVVIVPVAAMAATAIPAMAYFHTLPLYFLPANLLASIAIVPLMLCGVLLVAATLLGVEHGVLTYVCEKLYSFIELSARTFGGDAGVVHTYPSTITLICCLAAVTTFFILLYRPRNVLRIGILCCACISVALSAAHDRNPASKDAYILGEGTSTDILIADADSVYLITDATGINAANIRASRQQRYRDMLLRRTANAELTLLSGDFTRHDFKRSGNVLICGNQKILLVNGDSIVPLSGHCNYALVCRGFKKDILKAAKYADTILIGPSVHYRRQRRFVARLDSAKIPYKDIHRDGGIALHIAHN